MYMGKGADVGKEEDKFSLGEAIESKVSVSWQVGVPAGRRIFRRGP